MNSNKRPGVALTKIVCPICLKETESQIIMQQQFSSPEVAEKFEKELHNQILGFSDPCKNCQEVIDNGGVFLIGVDPDKTDDMENPYRSGHILGVKKEIIDDPKVREKGACFVDYQVIEKLIEDYERETGDKVSDRKW